MMTTTQTPAIACDLQGAYLIEASAGTGKTWTLTGILLRLLIEKNHAPERIIATTFTKAAAAEMQERLQQRLHDFYECCLWLERTLAVQNLYAIGDDERVQIFEQHKASIGALGDLVNQHLLNFLLNQHPKMLTYATHRTKLLFTSLDKLFVGTLDSLAQKWLNEFKAQIGYDDGTKIVPEPSEIVYAVVHDIIRAEKAKLYTTSPNLYQLVGNVHDINDGVMLVNRALNFYSADIDETLSLQDDDVLGLKNELDELLKVDFSHFFGYADKEYKEQQGIKGGSQGKVFYYFGEFEPLLNLLSQMGLQAFEQLTTKQKAFIEKLNPDHAETVFKKPEGLATWQSLVHLDKLYRLAQVCLELMNVIEQYQDNWRFRLVKDAKQQLKHRLEKEQKSTFYLQTARLNDALIGSQGRDFAQYIRHLYPVALIDEAQDVSGEQANLIERIYLSCDDDERMRCFLLLVGDPKQAIYRFRGGDVANYNRLKNMGVNSSLSLTVNRRSNAVLIDAINHWYNKPSQDSDDNEYSALGTGINYGYVSASQHEMGIHTQADGILPDKALAVLSLDVGDDKYDKIAKHINRLLQSDISIKKEQGLQALSPSDVAVLVRGKKDLMPISHALEKLNIPVVHSRDDSVFDSDVAKGIYWLAKSVLQPSRANIAALLTSVLYDYDLAQAHALLGQESEHNDIIIYLKNLRKRWLDKGVVAMLYDGFVKPFFANEPHDDLNLPKNLWLSLSQRANAQRHLTDAWHLFELLALQDLPPIRFMAWLHQAISGGQLDEMSARIVLPSEKGVNVMTIHKSKGLEFGVVYVLGLDGTLNHKDNGLYVYSDDNGQRRLSTQDNHATLGSLKELNKNEEMDELKRLGYVALTRASQLCFVVAQDKKKGNDCVAKRYLKQEKGSFGLPERLADKVDWIRLDDTKQCTTPYQSQTLPKTSIDYLNTADVYRQAGFVGVSKTSFSALVGAFVFGALVETPMPDYDEMGAMDAADEPDIEQAQQKPIGVGFVRGKQAGTFLHQVLEEIDPQNPRQVSQTIDAMLKRHGLPEYYRRDFLGDDVQTREHDRLVGWIYDIVNRPLSASGVAIEMLAPKDRHNELRFVLGLDEHERASKPRFSPKAVHDIFKQYSDKPVMSLQVFDNKLYGYLSGEIDLLYRHNDTYYVVDYKSNYLGDNLSDYQQPALEQAMNEHGYWLQAAIYQVALYRLLKLRIKDFMGNEQKYLGAVEYYFVRAADAELGGRHTAVGLLTWQVPLPLVQALDELFGDGKA